MVFVYVVLGRTYCSGSVMVREFVMVKTVGSSVGAEGGKMPTRIWQLWRRGSRRRRVKEKRMRNGKTWSGVY